MRGGSRKLLIIAAFTLVLIVLVNLAWWVFYDRTEAMLDAQLSRRLAAIAKTTAVPLDAALVERLLEEDFNAYMEVLDIISQARQADSLSEIFIVAPDFTYLATTSMTGDSTYFLAELNGPYIDSLFFGLAQGAITTPSYRTGSLYLKSAFVPLHNPVGEVAGVLGVEANVDYFDSLADLRQNLYYSTALSIAGGLVFGLLFLLVQRRLNLAQAQLFVNETHAYLGRMVAVVAHEVRNPLMIIRASAERLRRKHEAPESEFIVDEVDRLNSLVTGYLDVARGGAGQRLIDSEQPETIDSTNLVANLKKHFRDKYQGSEVKWIEDESAAHEAFVGYLRPLRQVLLNLMINAAEACQAAGRPIAVGLMVRRKGERLLLKVVDHGPGMSRQDRRKAGDMFFSTKQTGSGLGLYLSRKIVEQMGGTLHIDSRPGHGTTVTVSLPPKPTGDAHGQHPGS